MVTIEIIELSTNKRNVLGDGLAPNIGNYSMDRLSHRIHRGNPGKRRIQISNAYDDSKKIKSKKFLIKTNRLDSAYSEQELYYDKREDVGIRDILRRLTTVEHENKKLRKILKKYEVQLNSQGLALTNLESCQGIVKPDKRECDFNEICYRGPGDYDWVYGSSIKDGVYVSEGLLQYEVKEQTNERGWDVEFYRFAFECEISHDMSDHR